MLKCYLIDNIKFKDRNDDMDVVNIATFTGSVFVVPKSCPFWKDISKRSSWNFIPENIIRKELGQIWSAHLCGIFICPNSDL